MPHPVDGRAVEPRTELLRPGPDPVAPDRRQARYVNEEEVPPAGSGVRLGARRGAGRVEAASGLAFDHLVDTSDA
ncbi:hypothetical protein [Streptomyces sp. DSM 40907]|uniref:hypothetical protein n=1 Tax=Streptomyces kutzneri TaxID=3051179 RepID=UPI0028D55F70|nr:hypothetical protein [Streptomyces sp. DSM 40907]